MRLLCALVLLLAVQPCISVGQSAVAVPGTPVSMTPPAGWTQADTFTGFADQNTGSSIVVTHMAGASFRQTSAGFTKSGLASRGMQLVSSTPMAFGAHSGMFIEVRQAANGTNYVKWMAIFGDDSQTELVVASVKETYQAQLKSTVIASLKTARLSSGGVAKPLDGMLFSVQAKEPYKMSNRVQTTLLFTHGGVSPNPSPSDPLFVAGSSLGSQPVANQESFAKQRVMQTAYMADIKVYTSQKLTMDGLPGVQLMATATDSQTKSPMLIYQVILFDRDVYYIMQGIARQSDQAELALWYEMVKSFKRQAR